jgi:hypothetical protein
VHDDDVDETLEDGTYSPWMAQGIQFDLDNRNPQGSIFLQIKTWLAAIKTWQATNFCLSQVASITNWVEQEKLHVEDDKFGIYA